MTVLAALAIAAGWIVRDGLLARAELRQLDEALSTATGGLRDCGVHTCDGASRAALADSVASAVQHARLADEALQNPLWRAVEWLPELGERVRAARQLATAITTAVVAAGPVVPRLVDASPDLLTIRDATVDASGLSAASADLSTLASTLEVARSQVAAVDPDDLDRAMSDTRTKALTSIGSAASWIETASAAATVVPGMVSPDGSRRYLVLVTNPAEPRAAGGLVGTVLDVVVSQGRVTVESATPGNAVDASEPGVDLDESEVSLFGPMLATQLRDVGFTPDRPRAAQIAADLWQDHTGEHVDGVVLADPTVLAALLQATGGIEVTTTTGGRVALDATNAARVLMHDLYLQVPDPAVEDQLYASVATTVAERLLHGTVDLPAALPGLARAVSEQRLTLWSADSAVEEVISDSDLGGRLVGSTAAGAGSAPLVTVGLNATTASKMGWYLALTALATTVSCLDDGAQTLEVDVTLSSTAPATAAGLPPVVAGEGDDAGVVAADVLFYAPTGGQILSATRDGQQAGLFAQVQDGLAVGAATVRLAPGQSTRFTVHVSTGPGLPGAPRVDVSPTASSAHVSGSGGCPVGRGTGGQAGGSAGAGDGLSAPGASATRGIADRAGGRWDEDAATATERARVEALVLLPVAGRLRASRQRDRWPA